MFHLITGRSGSGKTEYLRKVLAEKAEAGNARLILLVPEQFSFDSERGMLEKLGNKKAQQIQVLSFSRLTDFVLKGLNRPVPRDPGDGTRILFMLRALEAVQDDLVYYGKHIRSVPLAKQLIQTEKEVAQASVLPEQLRALSADATRSSLQNKLLDLSLIFGTYDAMLSKKYPEADRSPEVLCRELDETQFLQGYTVAIDGFKGFTKQELGIVRRLFRQCDDVYIALCTPGPAADDLSLIFQSVNDTARQLRRIAKEENVRIFLPKPEETGIQNGLRFENDALIHLEKGFYSPVPESFGKEISCVTVCETQDRYDECNYIAATIRKLIREENYRCKDIAVIVRNEEDYRKDLTAALRQYDIPVFEDTRQPVDHQPLMVLCRTVLGLAQSFTPDRFLMYLKTGLSPLDVYECAVLENYILMWEIKGKELREPFQKNPDGLGIAWTDDSREELRHLEEFRKRAVDSLLTFRNRTKRGTFQEFGKALYDFLEATDVPSRLLPLAQVYADDGRTALAREQNAVWELLMHILDEMAAVYGTEVRDIASFSELFQAILSTETLGTIPQNLDEISVGSADRIRLASPRAVFVAGCEDGVFPASGQTGGIFTPSDRAELETHEIRLSPPEDIAAIEERFTAYSSVTSPSEKLYVTWHRMGTSGEGMCASSIVSSVLSLFEMPKEDENDPPKYFCTVLDSDTLPPDYYCETARSSFQTYASLIGDSADPEKQDANAIRLVLEEWDSIKSRLETLDRCAKRKQFHENPEEAQNNSQDNPEEANNYFHINSKIAKKLFGEHMGISASRVDKYYKCPFQYFCKFGIKAQPRKTAKLDPASSGTVIHYVLENLLREYRGDKIHDLIALSPEDRHKKVDRYLDLYLDTQMDGTEGKSARFLYLYRKLRITLYDVADRLCEEFAQSRFVPSAFELKVGGDEADIPAYRLDLEDGGSVAVYGSVDRVDTVDIDGKQYFRIIDYKSGDKNFIFSDTWYGLNLQMLIYLYAIADGEENQFGKPAGILYYPAKRKNPTNNANTGEISIPDNRENGLLLDDPEVLESMVNNYDENTRFVKILRAPYGQSDKNTASAEDFSYIKRKIDNLLKEMGQELHKGKIDAYPVYRNSDYNKVCEYCEYRPVCGHEQDDPTKDIPKLNFENTMKKFKPEKKNKEDS